MNKNAIKKFAIDARNKLIASVTDKAGMLGITPDNCSEAITKGADFEVYKTAAGTEVTLNKKQCEQRRKLVDQIHARGFEAVVEEVAYTWFNRICAIRFMEVNDYMYPVRVRVLSSEKEGKNEPDVVTMAPDIDWNFTDKEREEIIDAKMNNRLDDLFRMLFIKQCNLLHEVLPGLFEETEDYTEMLLNISFTNEDDVIRMLIDEKRGIPEEDFNVNTIGKDGQPTGQVEIIGWLYQYYNTELKDDTFAKLKKNVKITKERIPAATQLFTPDWIVRYMVENSVGRIWIEHLRAVDPSIDEKAAAEKFGWKYYLPEAEQEDEVNVKLAEIRTTYKDLKPTEIACIDHCMGSGHILIAMFDVLMDIYESAGYDKREASFEIVEHNIHGLDIDKRAYQLAYFAVMMKGRGYNRRFLSNKNIKHNIFKVEGSGFTDKEGKKVYVYDQATLDYFVNNDVILKKSMDNLIEQMFDAEEYGSILKIQNVDFDLIFKRFEAIESEISLYKNSVFNALYPFVSIAYILTQKYDAVITNPPYMGISGANSKLSDYVKCNYPISKADLFAVFIEKGAYMLRQNGYLSMITQQMFLFLPTYEKLRQLIFRDRYISSMVHLGYGTFGADFGTTAYCMCKNHNEKYNGIFIDLSETHKIEEKKTKFLISITNLNRYAYKKSIEDFKNLPGTIIAFWLSDGIESMFKNESLKSCCDARIGLVPGNNDHYLRYWMEVNYNDIGFNCDRIKAKNSKKKWFPYNKGGAYRKWYGNRDYVVDWYNDGAEMQTKKHPNGTRIWAHNFNLDYIFKKHIAWSDLTSGDISFRMFENGFLFDSSSDAAFVPDDLFEYILAYLNTELVLKLSKILNPTIHFKPGDFLNIPFKIAESSTFDKITYMSRQCIDLSKEDWNSFETSWEFKKHPLIMSYHLIKEAYIDWQKKTEYRYNSIKKYEQEIEQLFLKIFDLDDNEIEMKDGDRENGIKLAELKRDIRSLISYAVGCMFGRYSLDEEGLIYAGGEWDNSRYKIFPSDEDNCIPITDEEYFTDDIVGRFVEFVKTVYGADTLEENLDFIANALGNKGDTSREVIRNYFLKDFYADHLKEYQKRPIYWLFDSGKQNGFKALIYMHRYDADTVGRVRTDYLHNAQKYVETAMQSAQYTIDNATSSSEKSKATKAVTKYTKQLAEMKIYDEAIAHVANQRIEIDLDDGVKVNYAKFQGVEVAQEGKKALKVDLLAKI